MSTKALYQNKIESLRSNIASKKANITTKNEQIKDIQAKKSRVREKYAQWIKNASSTSIKANYRASLKTELSSLDGQIASKRREIESIKNDIANLQRELKSAMENKKKCKS